MKSVLLLIATLSSIIAARIWDEPNCHSFAVTEGYCGRTPQGGSGEGYISSGFSAASNIASFMPDNVLDVHSKCHKKSDVSITFSASIKRDDRTSINRDDRTVTYVPTVSYLSRLVPELSGASRATSLQGTLATDQVSLEVIWLSGGSVTIKAYSGYNPNDPNSILNTATWNPGKGPQLSPLPPFPTMVLLSSGHTFNSGRFQSGSDKGATSSVESTIGRTDAQCYGYGDRAVMKVTAQKPGMKAELTSSNDAATSNDAAITLSNTFGTMVLRSDFSVAMSSSSVRPFRQVATFALLSIMSSLSVIGKNIMVELQQSTSNGPIELKKRVVETNLNQLFKSSRDIDQDIRKECTLSLGQWIYDFPEFFMNTSYTRYLGWFLSDKSSIVRHAAVSAVSKLLRNPSSFSSLRLFAERHKDRIMEMAMFEVDCEIHKLVLTGILKPLAENGLFEDEEVDKLRCLLAADQYGYIMLPTDTTWNKERHPLRYIVAPIILNLFIEQRFNAAINEAKNNHKDIQKGDMDAFVKLTAGLSLAKWIHECLSGIALLMRKQEQETTKFIAKQTEPERFDDEIVDPFCGDWKMYSQGFSMIVDSIKHSLLESDKSSAHELIQSIIRKPEDLIPFIVKQDLRLAVEEKGLLYMMLTSASRLYCGIQYGIDGSSFNDSFSHSLNEAAHLKQTKVADIEVMRKDFSKTLVQSWNLLLQNFMSTGILLCPDDTLKMALSMAFAELCLWAMVGIPSYAEGPAPISAGEIWMDCHMAVQFEQCVTYLCSQVYAKLTNTQCINTFSRILFGAWRDGNDTRGHILALDSHSNPMKDQCNAITATFRDSLSADLCEWMDQLNRDDFDFSKSSKGASGDFYDNMQSFFYVMLRYECAVVGTYVTKDNLSQISDDILTFVASFIDSSNESLRISLKSYKSWLNLPVSESEDVIADMNDSDHRLSEIICSGIRIGFQTILWRFKSLESENVSDESFSRTLKGYVGLMSDLVRYSTLKMKNIELKARNDANAVIRASQGEDMLHLDKSLMSLLANDEAHEASSLEVALLAEEYATQAVLEDCLLCSVIGIRTPISGISTVSMVTDMISLLPFEGNENDECTRCLLKDITSFCTVISQSIFSNLLSNVDGGYSLETYSASELVKADDEQSLGGPKLQAWQKTFDYCNAVQNPNDDDLLIRVHVRRFLSQIEKEAVSEVLKRVMTSYVRLIWILKPVLKQQNEDIVTSLSRILSWTGKWNPWVDELVLCVMTEFASDSIESAQLNGVASTKCFFGDVIKNVIEMSLLEERTICSFGWHAPTKAHANGEFDLVETGIFRCTAKMIVQGIREAMGLSNKSSHTQVPQPIRLVVSELLSHSHSTIIAYTVRLLERCKNSVVPSLSNEETQIETDFLLDTIFHLLNVLSGTAGGVELLTPSDAATLHTQVHAKMNEQKHLLAEIMNELSKHSWETNYRKYLKTLAALAKKGGIQVGQTTKVQVGASISNKQVVRGKLKRQKSLVESDVSEVESQSEEDELQPKSRQAKRYKSMLKDVLRTPQSGVRRRSSRYHSTPTDEQPEEDERVSVAESFQSTPDLQPIRRY